jgi:hypothetical protein
MTDVVKLTKTGLKIMEAEKLSIGGKIAEKYACRTIGCDTNSHDDSRAHPLLSVGKKTGVRSIGGTHLPRRCSGQLSTRKDPSLFSGRKRRP